MAVQKPRADEPHTVAEAVAVAAAYVLLDTHAHIADKLQTISRHCEGDFYLLMLARW